MRFVLVAALLLSSVSFAQNSTGAEKGRQPKTEIRFDENELIDGTTRGPDGALIDAPPPIVFQSLIRIRTNFADKLMNSVNELR
jgi:hypothetical protein